MMTSSKKEEVPRCEQSQVRRALKREGVGSALVEQDIVAEAENDSIDRLIQECERKGLDQRVTKARRGCEDGGQGHGRMSRSAPTESLPLPAEPGLAAERAMLGLVGGESIFPKGPLTDSQCQNRIAAQWEPTLSEEPALVGGEGEFGDPSQVNGGDSSRVGHRELKESSTSSSVRLAFEPCRIELEQCCLKKGFSFAELGEVLSRALAVVESLFERCSQPKGDLFPLPLASALGLPGTSTPSTDALIRALNSLYGTRTRTRTKEDDIRRKLTERLHGVVSNSNLLDFHRLFQTKTVDYSGEEVQVARSFQWKMVEAAMPEAVGSLDLELFCGEGTLQYIKDFESFLLPAQDQKLGRTPTIMVEQRHWAEVCAGLLRKGVCQLMHVSKLHHVDGRPLLNGLFAVSKQETAVDSEGRSFEVCRLIMNLVPMQKPGGRHLHSAHHSWHVLGDSRGRPASHHFICFFYLFRTPASWWKYMGFAREVPAEALPEGFVGQGWHLVTQVLPMGFINSAAIAQHVHRRVISRALRGEKILAGRHQELRRDRVASTAEHLYRVYTWTTMTSCKRWTAGRRRR